MRKTRLKILPARCLAMIGFLLLYLACPILAELSRAQPDREMASFFQLQELQHCANPPEDPGEGGCMNSRNDETEMTRTVSPDNGHAHACFTTDVFLLKNTCSVDQGRGRRAEGRDKPSTRFANTAPRRLLAARSKDPPATVLKMHASRRQIKYRSLKRSQAPHEHLAVRSERREGISSRALLVGQNRDRTASESTVSARRSLFLERNLPTRTARKPLSGKLLEPQVPSRGSTAIQPPSSTVAGQRSVAKRDISRKMSTEMRTARTATERNLPQTDGSWRLALETQSLSRHPADRELSVHMRVSTARRSLSRISTDHRLHQSDRTRELIVAPGTVSAKTESSRRQLAENRMLEYGNSKIISLERQSSLKLKSDRISETLFRSRTTSKRNFSDTRLSGTLLFDIRQDDSKNKRALAERAKTSLLSTERFGSERRVSSKAEERRSYAERSFFRSTSLNEAGDSESRCLTRRFPQKSINFDRISGIRRAAIGVCSHTSTDSLIFRTRPLTSANFRSSGRLYAELPSMMSHVTVFHSLPSARLLSSYSEPKKNERDISESVSRIKSGRRSVIIPSDKPSSRSLSDRKRTSSISNERLPQISSNRMSPSRNSIDRNAVYRKAENRRISASEFEDRRNMRLNSERRFLSSESSDRLCSLRKTEERQSSSDRLRPLNPTVTTRTSGERRTSRTSPTTRRLLTSVVRRPANISDRRFDQTVSSRLSEFPASRRMSNERLLAQLTYMASRILSSSASNEHLSTESPAYRNNHFTETTARHSLVSTSAERAIVLRGSKRSYVGNLIALNDPMGLYTTRLNSENDSRSIESLVSVGDSRKISVERLVPVMGSVRFAERLKSAKSSSNIYAESLTSEKWPRKFAGRFISARDSLRISTERLRISRASDTLTYTKFSRSVSEKRLTSERNSKRYGKNSASVKNSMRVSAERLTSERLSRISTEYSSSERASTRITPDSRSSERAKRFSDPKVSADRMWLEKNSGRSLESSPSVTNSKTILTGPKNPTHSRRTETRLSLFNNSRKQLAETTETQRDSKSTGRPPFLGVSTVISHVLDHQSPSKRFAERLTTPRYSRIYVGRLTTQRNSRSTEHFTPLRDSKRTSSERLVNRHLTFSRNLRSIPTERLINQRSDGQPGLFVIGIDSVRPPKRMTFNGNGRITGEPVAFTRASRSISSESLSYSRDSRVTPTMKTFRQTNGDLTSTTRHRISSEITETQNNSKLTAMRLALVAGSRNAYTEMLPQSPRRSADRIADIFSTRRTTSERQLSERDSRSMAKRSTYVANPKISFNRWSSDREDRRTAEPLASVGFRKITTKRDSSPSVEHLASDVNSRLSAVLVTMRKTRHSIDRFLSFRNSRTYSEQMGSDRRSVDRLASSRKFRSGYTESFGYEINSIRSVVSTATNMNSRRISTERQVSERYYTRAVGHSTNLRNTRTLATNDLSFVRNSQASADRLKFLRSCVRISHERKSVSKKSRPDHLATCRSMEGVSTRTTSSERRISQPEPLYTICITSQALVNCNATRMSNTKNTRVAYEHISSNQALHQSFGLPEQHFSTADNTTLKTESFFGSGWTLETIQKSVVGFALAQHSSWSYKATECVRYVLATLNVMWPTLMTWKGGVLAPIESFDGELEFSPKMDHFNIVFIDKSTSNQAFVPDDLTPFGSTKTALPVMRDSHSILTTMSGGGVTAAVVLLSTRSK